MILHTFAQNPLVNVQICGQTPKDPRGRFGFLARSLNFTIEVHNQPIQNFFVISGNTFFIIGGHSNFEYKLDKIRVEGTMNSNMGPRISATSSRFSHQSFHQSIGHHLGKL
jgi:hypothetical protein